MSSFRGRAALSFHRRFLPVRLTGRCFLLRPRHTASTTALQDVRCVELTQGDASLSSRQQQRSMPGSLMGNSYYTQRYRSANNGDGGNSGATASPSTTRFLSGDLILRLCSSAVSHGLSNRRTVDVTGTQTSFFNSSERDWHALATVEETLRTMHLHDGYEVPALQRGDVDLVCLQPQCVYAPSLALEAERGGSGRQLTTAAPAHPSLLDLTNVESALYPLDNPGVLLAQPRRLSFRSEMDAVQVARVMAAAVAALRQRPGAHRTSAPSSGALLKPLVRDGHVVGVALRFLRGSGQGR